jgi:MFS family permease
MIRIRNTTLLLASTLMVLAAAAIAPALPAIAESFAGTPGSAFWVHQLVTVTGLAVALSAPLLGRLLDGRDPRGTLLVSLALAGISGSAGFFFPDSLVLLLASRLLLGLAVAGVMLSFTLLAACYFQGSALDGFLGLQASAGAYGAVVYLAVGGLLADGHWSWSFLLFLLPLFLVLPAWLTLNAAEGNASAPTEGDPAGAMTAALKGLYALGLIEALFLYWVLVHLPFELRTLLDSDASGGGVALAGMMLISAVTAGLYPRLRGERSFALIHGLAFCILASGLAVLTLSSGMAPALLSLLLLGVALGLMRPNSMRWLLDVAPPAARGRAFGIYTSAFFIGQFLSGPFAEPAVASVGRPTAFALAAVLAIGVGLVLLALGARQQRQPSEQLK